MIAGWVFDEIKDGVERGDLDRNSAVAAVVEMDAIDERLELVAVAMARRN